MNKFVIKNLLNNVIFAQNHITKSGRTLTHSFRKRDRRSGKTELFLYFKLNDKSKHPLYTRFRLINTGNRQEFRILNKNGIKTNEGDGENFLRFEHFKTYSGSCRPLNEPFDKCESGVCGHAICMQNEYNQDYYN